MNPKIYRTRMFLAAVLWLIILDAQAQLNFNPPRIVVSNTPLELMLIDGPPSKVAISGTRLEFVVNTDRDVFYDSENEAWYSSTNPRTSYLEVLESERSLFRAELLASATRREQIVAIVRLYKALGGGWESK